MPSHGWAIGRLVTIALVLVVATMLSGCAVITQRLANPQVSTPPHQVLLDANFNDRKLDRPTCCRGGV